MEGKLGELHETETVRQSELESARATDTGNTLEEGREREREEESVNINIVDLCRKC